MGDMGGMGDTLASHGRPQAERDYLLESGKSFVCAPLTMV
jgi:hypothetical protein